MQNTKTDILYKNPVNQIIDLLLISILKYKLYQDINKTCYQNFILFLIEIFYKFPQKYFIFLR